MSANSHGWFLKIFCLVTVNTPVDTTTDIEYRIYVYIYMITVTSGQFLECRPKKNM